MDEGQEAVVVMKKGKRKTVSIKKRFIRCLRLFDDADVGDLVVAVGVVY